MQVRTRFRAGTMGIAIALALAIPLGGQELDPDSVKWSELSYRAKKLKWSIASDVKIEMVPAATASGNLLAPLEGRGVEPQGDVLLVTLTADGAGTRSTTRLWADPRTADSMQRNQISYGKKKNRNKTLRFTDTGVQIFFGRAAAGESVDQPEAWSDSVDRFDPFPAWAGDDIVVTEASAIFYVVAASKLEKPGDKAQYPVWSNESLILMEMTVAGVEQLKVNYSSNGEQVKGSVPVLKILVDAQHLDPDSIEDDLEIMGMKGDIEIYLDAETRAPLQISGKVPVAGNTHIKLQSVTLR